MENDYVIVLITTPSREIAREIAHHLVQERLAACVNITIPVESIYTWEGQIQTDEERLLIIKTRAELVESQLVPAVRSIHPYQTPEIIALSITAGYQGYLDWIGTSTR